MSRQPSLPTGGAALRRAALPLALGVALLACAVLLGWALDSIALMGLGANDSVTKANTALGLLLCAAGICAQVAGGPPALVRVAGAAAALIGLLILAEHAAGVSLGIDELLVADRTGLSPVPGRGSVNSSLCLVLLGMALVLLDREWHGRWPAGGLALAAGAVGFVGIVGYAGGEPAFYSFGAIAHMSMPTAAALMALAAAVILIRPERAGRGLLLATGPGATLARRLMPAVLVAPVVLGVLRLQGQEAGLFGQTAGTLLLRPRDGDRPGRPGLPHRSLDRPGRGAPAPSPSARPTRRATACA